MDRRLAMKNLGLALGYSVATPTLISLVQSCKRETGPVWTPQFFTPEEGLVVMILADLILPKTNTPSATEVGVHVFIDGLLNEVSSAEEQDFFKNCMGKFTDKALTDTGKNSVADLSGEDMEPLLAETLKRRT
ncbi:MAG: gluconate 2-dehydrogenase subunit 3 family protein, partial [Robiginitalea sp.]